MFCKNFIFLAVQLRRVRVGKILEKNLGLDIIELSTTKNALEYTSAEYGLRHIKSSSQILASSALWNRFIASYITPKNLLDPFLTIFKLPSWRKPGEVDLILPSPISLTTGATCKLSK